MATDSIVVTTQRNGKAIEKIDRLLFGIIALGVVGALVFGLAFMGRFLVMPELCVQSAA